MFFIAIMLFFQHSRMWLNLRKIKSYRFSRFTEHTANLEHFVPFCCCHMVQWSHSMYWNSPSKTFDFFRKKIPPRFFLSRVVCQHSLTYKRIFEKCLNIYFSHSPTEAGTRHIQEAQLRKNLKCVCVCVFVSACVWKCALLCAVDTFHFTESLKRKTA